MKVLALLLAIVASVAAQSINGHVLLRTNTGQTEVLLLILHGTMDSVIITGHIRSLTPGMYMAMVHEGRKITDACDSLGPVRQTNSAPFYFAFIEVPKNGYIQAVSPSATLEPDKPNSVDNRSIAIYDLETFDPFSYYPNSEPVACGLVNIIGI